MTLLVMLDAEPSPPMLIRMAQDDECRVLFLATKSTLSMFGQVKLILYSLSSLC